MADGAESERDALIEHNETVGLFKLSADPVSPALDGGFAAPRSMNSRNCSTC